MYHFFIRPILFSISSLLGLEGVKCSLENLTFMLQFISEKSLWYYPLENDTQQNNDMKYELDNETYITLCKMIQDLNI